MRCLRNSVFNDTVESIQNPERDSKVARYTSTSRLLTSYIEKGERTVKFAKTRVSLDVWAGLPGVLLEFHRFGTRNFYLPVPG